MRAERTTRPDGIGFIEQQDYVEELCMKYRVFWHFQSGEKLTAEVCGAALAFGWLLGQSPKIKQAERRLKVNLTTP